jgi:hypothetical protein
MKAFAKQSWPSDILVAVCWFPHLDADFSFFGLPVYAQSSNPRALGRGKPIFFFLVALIRLTQLPRTYR